MPAAPWATCHQVLIDLDQFRGISHRDSGVTTEVEELISAVA